MSSVARSSVFMWKRLQKSNNIYMLNVVNGVFVSTTCLAGWLDGWQAGWGSVSCEYCLKTAKDI